jgi:DNA replication and repair protein RecF
MQIQKIYLQGFRNYKNRSFDFRSETTVIVGPNAVGKTNVLEAINLLATGESFRAKKIDEMVGWNHEVGHVGAKIQRALQGNLEKTNNKNQDKQDEVELRAVLTRGVVNEERAQKRKFLVNGVARRKKDFVGNLVVVTFLPVDLALISGSPSKRRKYLDTVLSQVDRQYYRSLLSYEKGLRRRNRLLDLIRDGQANRSGLMFWDQLLIKEGNVLTEKRQELIDYINETGNGLRVVFDNSTISEKRLEQYEKEEVMAGYTLVGPHKDDFFIESVEEERSRDLSVFGSRGEQRMAVLWLKMKEIDFVEKSIGERPVLLLDDIFSELDLKHENMVWKLTKKQQTLVTTTELENVGKRKLDIIKLEL